MTYKRRRKAAIRAVRKSPLTQADCDRIVASARDAAKERSALLERLVTDVEPRWSAERDGRKG